ncbi:aminodeoxychorismate synthase component I [Sulfurimonas lithotrophica]|uniref:Aminodeoxychorismate synthase component I n=1 Tax=Sulfurimonas lithotrophica TaxID=2590022 RepID=A0A5P8NZ12_9BACT|nr:aminodeoxychorismate synthase component I [Sulfurimonas lithotrophica]QFR48685.1 aminodeoxychorismate synthase component I [Sulfurimonas lithotrophica]
MMWDKLNSLGKDRIPFLFISDFEAKELIVIPLDELSKHDVEYSINENYEYQRHRSELKKTLISFDKYKEKFDYVQEKIKNGDTYLLNLTAQTKIDTDLTLKEIFKLSNAHYKLRYKDEFVCFSPEKFVQIKDNTISTFPMKGTIDASVPQAQSVILANEKEMAEHIMVVDLLRNDLSMVSKNVKVKKFRYITTIDAGDKKLLQVSSHINGELENEWHENIGNILKKLLPAGSISGTPKKSTLDIIKTIEDYERGFFSGVFGIYDGESLDSGVMIRFIEKNKNGYVYKSGGGITLDSDSKSEYKELLDKIYLP